jgi:hypothetical protein
MCNLSARALSRHSSFLPLSGNVSGVVVVDVVSTMDYGQIAICHSLEDRPHHYVDTTRNEKELVEISYVQIQLSPADVICCVLTCLKA